MMIMFPFAVYGALAGSVITILGTTVVFVPQDITYLGFTPTQVNAVNPHLIPLIAHNPAGFGGGLVSDGLMVFLIVWKALLVGGITGSAARSACIGYDKMWEDAGSMPPVC
jgi:hypothetical protein